MNGRSRPYFYGIDRSLNFQQKEALTQGIQQVVDTTPTSFEFFQFQFSSRQVYIYKLKHGIILLVLTVERLIDTTYPLLIEQLKLELEQDLANTIATFHLLAGSTTLSEQQYWKQGTDSIPVSVASQQPTVMPVAESVPVPNPSQTTLGSLATTRSQNPSSTPTPTPTSTASVFSDASSQPVDAIPLELPPSLPTPACPDLQLTSASRVLLKDILTAINHLSQYATQYLGPMVVANYWRTTRPPVDWLNRFQIERSAQITCSNQQLNLTTEQHQWLKDWVAAFIARCAKVIRDLPKTVKQNALDDRQKFLLFSNPY